jgi:hypothetical protein
MNLDQFIFVQQKVRHHCIVHLLPTLDTKLQFNQTTFYDLSQSVTECVTRSILAHSKCLYYEEEEYCNVRFSDP